MLSIWQNRISKCSNIVNHASIRRTKPENCGKLIYFLINMLFSFPQVSQALHCTLLGPCRTFWILQECSGALHVETAGDGQEKSEILRPNNSCLPLACSSALKCCNFIIWPSSESQISSHAFSSRTGQCYLH